MRVHVVTGASSGIGRAVALRLAARGEHVLAVARGEGALDELRLEAGSSLRPLVADVSMAQGRAAVADAPAPGAVIVGLVHSAGSLVLPESYEALDVERLAEHFKTHVGAPIDLNQRLTSSHHVERILYLDSYSASDPRVGWSGYSIIKSAAQMAARSAAEELTGPIVIRCYPGAVNTPLVQTVLSSGPSPTREVFRSFDDRGEVAEPGEVAEFIVGLLLDTPGEILASRSTWTYQRGV